MRRIRLPLAALLAAMSLFAAAPADAASGMLFSYDVPDPVSGARCYRRIEIWYDTTKVPPVWSRGYVVCN